MEDPWVNAWGDSSKPVLPEPSQLWATSPVAVLHTDNEDDLSIPSWPKGSVSSWSAEDLSADHIWSTTDSSTWNPTSTFDEISSAGGYTPQESSRTETQEAGCYASSSPPLHEEEAWALPKTQLQDVPSLHSFPGPIPSGTSETTNVGPRSEDTPQSALSPISLPKLIPGPMPEEVDGFGSFETGQDNLEKESWIPTNSVLTPISSTDSANWDSALPVETEHENNEQEDAWEAARMQKEKRDRHVPPELLSSILRQLEELSNDIWEDLGTTSAESNDNMDFEMLGLKPILTRLSPDDMTLPPTVPFSKTFAMKYMSESLKLTRHYTSTRSSPMAMYLASKGSNSWEAAVKARPIVTSDDVTPVGWKILDSSTQGESPLDDEKKKGSSIFSFFGRRAHNLSVDGNPKRSASPKTSTPPGSPATVEPSNASERSKPAVSGLSNVVSDKSIPILHAAQDEIQPDATQPSAVSRLLGRIVGHSKTRSIDSLALSADDVKFLADIPTSSDNKGLQNEDLITVSETPLPLRPFTPPSRQESPLPKLPPPPSRSTQPRGSDDLLSLFDPTTIPTSPDIPSTMNFPPPFAMPSKSEEPSIKSRSSRHLSLDSVDLLKSSSSRPTTNGVKSNVVQVQKSSGSASIPTPAPTIFPSTTPPLKPVQVDDDEFSDFLSSPPVQGSQFSSFSLESLGTPSMPIPSIRMTDTHRDDFGEFGGAVNDFPAHRPPASETCAPAIVSIPPTQSETHTRKKVSKKADHSRTLSLLETAAARGRWLSPPSPIPEALSPPPNRYASRSTVVPDGHKLDMQTQQSLAMAAYPSDTFGDTGNARRLPPPPSGTLLKPSMVSLTPVHSRLMPPSRPEFVAQSSRSPSSAQPGGLSAQDLSFFEGL